MILLNPGLFKLPWFHVKFASVILLTVSTFYAGKQVGVAQRSEAMPRGVFFRVMNEVPTLLMVVIVIMVIVRPWQ
jgi:putative membrane protein